MRPNPIHPGGSPRDIARQQKVQEIAQQAPKREAVAAKINQLLKDNQIEDVFVQPLNALGMVIVFLDKDASEEKMNAVLELLKANGATEKDGQKQVLVMGDVEFFVDRNHEMKLIW